MNSYIINTLDWLAVPGSANLVNYKGEWYTIEAGGKMEAVCGGEASWENVQIIQAMLRGGIIREDIVIDGVEPNTWFEITDFGREALALWQSFEYVAGQLEAEYWELAGESADNELIPVQLQALFEIISTIRPRYAIRDTANEAERLLRSLQVQLRNRSYNGYIATLFVAANNWLIAWKYIGKSHRFQGYPILGLKAEHAR